VTVTIMVTVTTKATSRCTRNKRIMNREREREREREMNLKEGKSREVYISDNACPRVGVANDTPHARIAAAVLIQGAHADTHSHRHYRRCPLTATP
jgi:hypothetical protein